MGAGGRWERGGGGGGRRVRSGRGGGIEASSSLGGKICGEIDGWDVHGNLDMDVWMDGMDMVCGMNGLEWDGMGAVEFLFYFILFLLSLLLISILFFLYLFICHAMLCNRLSVEF